MEAILTQDERLERWMKDYAGLIFTICYSMTKDYFQSEDLTQETFVSAYRAMGSFDGKNEKAWLVKIATNKCKDFLKSAARRILPAEAETFEVIASKEPEPAEVLLSTEVREKMLRLCEELKEPYKKIAFDYFLYNKKPEQIATETGKNIKTVQTQIYRARAMLRKLWKEEPV